MENSQFLPQCGAEEIQSAAQTLFDGNLVAFPTETVYGLGADATNSKAIARLYKVKGRPSDHPLIVHISSVNAMNDWVSEVPDYAASLARDFWPGPMTLILKRSNIAKNFITGGQDSVGIRIPNHPIALALLQSFSKLGGKGVAAPSANRFGHVSPTTSNAVRAELDRYLMDSDQVLDGGQSIIGLESTIIDCRFASPQILRPGAVTAEMILHATGLFESRDPYVSNLKVSGSLEKHYSPKAQVFLDQIPLIGQGYIALSNYSTPVGVTRLASPENNDQFARELYIALRKADELGLNSLVIQQPAGDGLAIAIRDRVVRASKGR